MPGESADQQPSLQPEPNPTAIPEKIVAPLSEKPQVEPNAPEFKPQEEKPTLAEQEWKEILGLGSRSFLDLNPDELVRLQGLTKKGKELMGDDFDSQLKTKKAEVQRKKDEQVTARSEKLNQELSRVTADFGEKAREIMQGFKDRDAKRQTEADSREAAIRRQLDEARKTDGNTAQVLKDALISDPKMAGIKAELAWMDLLAGKPVEGVDPELAKRVAEFKKDARARIMKNPRQYEEDLQTLKSEFYKSRGANLENNPKANTI